MSIALGEIRARRASTSITPLGRGSQQARKGSRGATCLTGLGDVWSPGKVTADSDSDSQRSPGLAERDRTCPPRAGCTGGCDAWHVWGCSSGAARKKLLSMEASQGNMGSQTPAVPETHPCLGQHHALLAHTVTLGHEDPVKVHTWVVSEKPSR